MDVRKQDSLRNSNTALLFDSLTIGENLSYPLREHTKLTEKAMEKKVKESLGQVGLDGSQALFPGDLSGGMHRRVGVAAASSWVPR